MNKFEKSVTVSGLSFALAGGMLAVGAGVDHIQNQDRRACYSDLDGTEQEKCLNEININTNSEQILELGVLLSFLGGVAAGVQAIRGYETES